MNALRIAATGMAAQQTRVDVISNNIANMSTTAYQPRVAEFADLLYQQHLQPGAISSQSGNIVPAGIQMGMGVRASTVSMEIVQGGLSPTGGDLDLALEGRGYFEITLPSGDAAYTRDGKFYRDGEGLIVNSEGYALADNITIPNDARSITISQDGEVTAFFNNEPEGQQIGQISMTVFVNPKGLEAMGSNLFRETSASGSPVVGQPGTEGIGTMRQGYLEDSGVDVVEEISELIEAQRGYELNSKVITAADEMYAATTRIR
ncbi:MAG: flagellar basal-body rod protein FlgG [Alphaproteobacteria bacterium]